MTNLGIGTDDSPPIWLPGIKKITERIIRHERQYAGIPIKIRKRDITNAFKRVPLHPDYIAIFRRQFEAHSSGLRQGATVGQMALPFGFAAAPTIFAICAEAIQRVHRSLQARD